MLHSLTKHTRWRAIWKWIKMSLPFQIISSYLSSTLSFRIHIAKDESDDTKRKVMKCMKYQDPHHNYYYHHYLIMLMIWSGQAVKLQVSRQYLCLHILPSRCQLKACVTNKCLSRLSHCWFSAGVPLDTGGQVCLHVAPLHSLRPRVWGPVHFQNVGKLQITIMLSDTWLYRLESGPILLAVLGQPHSWELKSWKGDCT